MFYLGNDFIITSLLWLFIIAAFVFTFRKHIKRFFYPSESLDLFVSKLKIFLEKTYPDIKFDYSIIEATKDHPNPTERKYTIIDDIFTQYKKIQIDPSRYPHTTPQNLQWNGYVFNCEPNRDKLPKDWVKRKDALFKRDHRKCFRCGRYVDINSMHIKMITPLEKGGKYNLENLIPLCIDCDKLLSRYSKKMNNLFIKDKLNEIVQTS